jgi:hypothetical protein
MAILAILLLSCITLALLRIMLPEPLRYLLGRREFAVAMLLPGLAFVSPFYLLYAVGIAAVIAFVPAFTTGDPALAMQQRLRLLFFALPLLPALQYSAMISTFTIVQLQSAVILCFGVVATMAFYGLPKSRPQLAGWDMTFGMMMLAALFMDARSSDMMFTLRMAVQVMLNLGLPYFVISRAFAISRVPATLFIVLLFGSCIIAVIAIFESFRFWLLYEALIKMVGADPETLSGYTKVRGGMLRARATFGESTGLSLFLGVALTLLYAIRRQFGSVAFVWVMGAVLAAGIVLAFARVGYLAAGVGLILCLLHERRYAALAWMLLLVLPAVGLGLLFLAKYLPFLAASIGSSSDAAGSMDYRSMLITAGLGVLRQHPWFGLSMTDLLSELAPLKQGEGIVDLVNQPLTILMRGGLFGSLLYATMLFRVAFTLFMRRGLDVGSRACATACFAGVLALVAGLMTTSFGRNDLTFILLLAAGAGLLSRRAPAAAAQPKVAANNVLPSQPAAAPVAAAPSMKTS